MADQVQFISLGTMMACLFSNEIAVTLRSPLVTVNESFRVRLYWSKSGSESDIASQLDHRKSNLMFTLSSDKNHRRYLLSRSPLLSVNEPLNVSASSAVRSASVT